MTRARQNVRPAATRAFIRATLALLLALGASLACAEELGRLFFTPQQRQDMDRRRATNSQAAASAAVTATDQITVNGQVLRSSGRSTTWINGVPQNDLRRDAGRDAAHVDLRAGEDASSTPVKVGETLDRLKGEKNDPLEGGKIVVRHR